MANFFDKLGDLAKSAAEKTTELIEQNKQNSIINAEEASIAKFKEQIGNYYFEQFENGKTPEGPTMEWYDGIKTSTAKIAELKAEILKMKEEQAHPGTEPEKAAGEQVESTAKLICSTCAAENALGAKFCANCGAKL